MHFWMNESANGATVAHFPPSLQSQMRLNLDRFPNLDTFDSRFLDPTISGVRNNLSSPAPSEDIGLIAYSFDGDNDDSTKRVKKILKPSQTVH